MLVVFLASVTSLPAIMLLLVQIVFAGSFAFLRANLYLLPAITLFSLAQVLLASSTMLALSSLSKSSRFVGVMYAGLIFFTGALFQAAARHHRRDRLAWLSPTDALEQLGDVDLPAAAALRAAALAWRCSSSSCSSSAPVAVLERRVRGVEVVS